MLTDHEQRALERARALRWVERKLRNQRRYIRRMVRMHGDWGSVGLLVSLDYHWAVRLSYLKAMP